MATKPLSARGKLILSAAQALFLKHGYDNTSLEMIINEAGGSRRSIYNEFGNKQGLLFAVMQQQVSIQVGIIADIDYTLPPDQAIKSIAFRFVRNMLSPTLTALFRLAIQVIPKLPDIGKIIYEKGPLAGVTPLVNYLTHLDKQGVLVIEDSVFAGQMLIEMVKGRLHLKAMLLPNVEITDEEIKQHVDRSVDLFLQAYGR